MIIFHSPLKPSGHYMYRQFNIKNPEFYPHSVHISSYDYN